MIPKFRLFSRRVHHIHEIHKESVTHGRLRTMGLFSFYGRHLASREAKGHAPNACPVGLSGNLESWWDERWYGL